MGRGIQNVAEHHAVMAVKAAMQSGLVHVKNTVDDQYDHLIEQHMRLSMDMPPHQKSIRFESGKLDENNKALLSEV